MAMKCDMDLEHAVIMLKRWADWMDVDAFQVFEALVDADIIDLDDASYMAQFFGSKEDE